MILRRITPKALVALLLILSVVAVSAELPLERWHVLTIDGTAVGPNHEVFERDNNQSVTTESMLIVLNRLGARIEAGVTAKSIENDPGELISVELAIQQSGQTGGLLLPSL